MPTSVQVRSLTDLNSDKVLYRGKGISFTATAATTTSYDFKFSEDRILTSGYAILDNQANGDYITIQVIDIDNVLGYGANTILDEYLTEWYMIYDQAYQPPPPHSYPALIQAGIYLRVKYTATGVLDIPVKMNFTTHKPRA